MCIRDRHRLDGRTVGLENALDALAVRNLAHGERRVQTTALDGDDHALISLNALTRTFLDSVSYTHLRAHETVLDLVCRLLLDKKNKQTQHTHTQQHNKQDHIRLTDIKPHT